MSEKTLTQQALRARPVTPGDEDRRVRIKRRIRALSALRKRADDEIVVLRHQLALLGDVVTDVRAGRDEGTASRPRCGTDAGYCWHRYHEPENWPLPPDDPCGCRAAHTARMRVKEAARRLRETSPQRTAREQRERDRKKVRYARRNSDDGEAA